MIHFLFIFTEISERRLLNSWDQNKTIRAVDAVRNKQMGFKKAQKMFNVLKSSLRRYVSQKDKTPEGALLTKLV